MTALLRGGLALVAGVDIVVVAANVATTEVGSRVHPLAPALLRALFDRPVPVACVALIGLAALVQFGRGQRQGLSGAIGLVALALLTEAHAALVGGPMRSFFTSGAMLFGWLFGLACAKGSLGSDTDGASRARLESDLAEAGAAGALAATYVGAGLSKLLASGPAWGESTGLRAVVLSQHPVNDSSVLGAFARAVGASAGLASAFALATVVIQLGAVAYPFSARLRAVVGSALLAFHLGVAVLLHIVYVEASVLVALFSYPWPRWVGLGPVDPVEGPLPMRWSGLAAPAFALAACLAIVSLAPVRAYTSLHHREGRRIGADRVEPRPAPPTVPERR